MDQELSERLAAIEEELYAQLERPPSDQDRLAIRAALANAAARAHQLGMATVAARVRAALGDGETASIDVLARSAATEPEPEPEPPAETRESGRRGVTDIWGQPLSARRRGK